MFCKDTELTIHYVLHIFQLASRSLVFFAVNNNTDVNNAEGGSHWCASAKKQPLSKTALGDLSLYVLVMQDPGRLLTKRPGFLSL